MQRQQLCGFLGAAFVAPLDDFGDARMQFSPSLVREPLVGRVTDERMPEPERPGDIRIALDEFAEPGPYL